VSSAAAPAGEFGATPQAVAGLWLRHLVAFLFPAVSLLFLWTGPHRWYVAPLLMMPLVVLHQIDCGSRVERRQPAASLPAWPFDAIVYALAALQFLVVFELVRLFSVQGIFSVDMVMVFVVVGGTSGFSIITAHELIHRSRVWEQTLGRALLCTVLYEHFFTEHLRGHHVRVGTPEDPATARFGEAYDPFFRRTVPAQFRSAWRLEAQRLGDADMRLGDRRTLHNRVLHGLVVELGLCALVAVAFGGAALFAFVLQAFTAIRLLEAVNYFEHWGLLRRARRVRLEDSWDTHSWLTYYGFIGLTRHADHHARPARPFHQLRAVEEAPILPLGYVGTIDLVLVNNAEFQERAAEELARRGLGPFAEGAVGREQAIAVLRAAQDREAGLHPKGGLGRAWLALPQGLRAGLAVALVLLGVTAGVQWEAHSVAMGFGARLLLNAWILGSVVLAIFGLRRIDERISNESFAFGAGFAILIAAGLLSEAIFPV
jgi:alkane 1-monooxygenase